MKRVDVHKWEVTEPTPIAIGMPESPPPAAALDLLKQAVANTGATEVYWFWVSIDGDVPHLGLAVAPDDDAVVSRIGEAVGTRWKQLSRDNPTFDILRLGSPLDETIRSEGRLLFSSTGA